MRAMIVVLGAVALAIGASASDAKGVKVKIASGVGLQGKPSYGPDVLKPEQLEQCLRNENEINQSANFLNEFDKALSAKAATIEQVEKQLHQNAARLDRTSQQAVDGHNANVRRFKAFAQDYDSQAKVFNGRVQVHNANIEQFNSGCANKKYYESDMKAARERVGP